MIDASFYLTRYSCPLFVVNEHRNMLEIVGTSIPFATTDRLFLLTAKHIVEWHGKANIFYPTDHENDLRTGVSQNFIGDVLGSTDSEMGIDDIDIAILEIEQSSLSSVYSPVPQYMISKSITLKHVDKITLIGYPLTRNKFPPNSRHYKVKSMAYELIHDITKYDDLGLNPVTHFCARFNAKKMKDENGHSFQPPHPRGLSGGQAWHIGESARRTKTDEGASLLGIISEYNEDNHLIWGPRMTYVLGSFSNANSQVRSDLNILMKHRTTDINEIQYFNKAKRNV